MKTIEIDASKITDWKTFHNVFNAVFGFPKYYGNNMDAWIDCMTYIDEPDSDMTKINIQPGENLTLKLQNSKEFIEKHQDIYQELLNCISFVNKRKFDDGTFTSISISRD